MNAFAKLQHSSDSASRRGNVKKAPMASDITSQPLVVYSNTSLLPGSFCTCGGGCLRCLGVIQPKLTISQPNDKYEQEADRMADQVMRMPVSHLQRQIEPEEEEEELLQTKSLPEQMTPLVQRQPEEEEEEETLQTKPGGGQRSKMTLSFYNRLQSLRGSGQPLTGPDRAFFGRRMLHDFSGVQVHTDSEAALMNHQLGARAFTHGHDIYFGAGQYDPHSSQCKRLIAHELAHVLQQKEDRIQRDDQGVTTEEFDLAQQKRNYQRLVDRWYDRYQNNLQTNARRARNANQRFIEFEEGGINQLRTVGSLGGSVIALFGGPAAVVGLCVTVLTEVAAQNLSSKEAKIAAAASNLGGKLEEAQRVLESQRDNLDARIESMTSPYDHTGWWEIFNLLGNYGVPEVVSENIIYRDLLLELARGGGYNISGSQWNVDNMSIFGDAPWYHSWDWGSPGWTNGRDIVDELNKLAEGDPSTRIRVSINPP